MNKITGRVKQFQFLMVNWGRLSLKDLTYKFVPIAAHLLCSLYPHISTKPSASGPLRVQVRPTDA
jgi:hypothetical protein